MGYALVSFRSAFKFDEAASILIAVISATQIVGCSVSITNATIDLWADTREPVHVPQAQEAKWKDWTDPYTNDLQNDPGATQRALLNASDEALLQVTF